MVSKIITDTYDSMSKTHKQIANYVLRNMTDTSYMSIKELSEKTKAGEATIIRFCIKLGFEGYPEFKKAVKDELRNSGNITDRLRESYEAYEGRGEGIIQMLQDDIRRIENTISNLNIDEFFEICDAILSSKKIYIIASRSAASIGSFFQYYLNMTLGNVELITDMGCGADKLSSIGEGDVAIGISFVRYAKSTVNLFRYSHEKGAATIAITDSKVSPLVKYSDRSIFTDTAVPSYIDSFVAPFSIINAILFEIGRQKNVELEKRMTELDNIYDKFKIF